MSPEEVTAGEAIVTLLMFPFLVLVAWGQSTGWTWCTTNRSTNERIKFTNLAKLHDSPEAALEELKAQNPVKRSYMVYRANAIRDLAGKKNVLKAAETSGEENKDVEMKNLGDEDPAFKVKQNNAP